MAANAIANDAMVASEEELNGAMTTPMRLPTSMEEW